MRHFQTLVLFALSLSSTRAFAEIESRAFRGTLVATPSQAHLQKAAYFAPDDGPHLIPVERMSRAELNAELDKLDRERPGLGGPIALMSIGGALFIPGVYLLIAAAAFTEIVYLVAGIVLTAGAATMLSIGIVMLVKRIPVRNQMAQRMDELKARLDTTDRNDSPRPPTPSNEDFPPPPPPPPPGAGLLGIDPQWVVASF